MADVLVPALFTMDSVFTVYVMSSFIQVALSILAVSITFLLRSSSGLLASAGSLFGVVIFKTAIILTVEFFFFPHVLEAVWLKY